jgi:hypothetical protein
MKLKRNIAVLALMGMLFGLAGVSYASETSIDPSAPSATQNTEIGVIYGANTGILDIKSGSEAGMGVEVRHIENGTYRAYQNPGQFTETTSGNVYIEAGNRTGFERVAFNNVAHRNQWGGVSYGGKKWGSLGVFIGRPYSGVAARHNTDLYTTNAIPSAINTGLTGIITDHVTARGAIGAADPLALAAGNPYADFTGVTAAETSLVGSAIGTILVPEGKLDVFYGYKFTDKISAGLMLEIESGKAKAQDNVQTTTGTASPTALQGVETFSFTRRTSDIGFSGGVTVNDLGWKVEKWDLSARINFPKVNNKVTQSVTDQGTVGAANAVHTFTETLASGSNFNFSILSRAVIKLNDSTKFIPFISYARQKADLTDTVTITTGGVTTLSMADSRADSANVYTFEWAINSKITDRTLLVVANGLNINVRKQRASRNITTNFGQFSAGDDYSGKYAGSGYNTGLVEDDQFGANTLNIPLWIGVEHQVSKPFMLRTGVFKNVYSKTSNTWTSRDYGNTAAGSANTATYGLIRTNTQKTFTDNQTPAVVSVGIGAKVTEDLTVDAVVQKNIFFTGTTLLSSITDPVFTQISARYRF